MVSSVPHRKRFEKWRSRLPHKTAFLVDQVRALLLPEFETRGYAWTDDYAEGNSGEVGYNEIPLQRRIGENWPTVHLRFDSKGRPFFHVFFAMLPPVCRTNFARDVIPRSKATIISAPAFFSLGRANGAADDGLFGYKWFSPWPKQKLVSEVNAARQCLPFMFDQLDRGIPSEWLVHEPGRVDKHIMLHGSWFWDQKRRERVT